MEGRKPIRHGHSAQSTTGQFRTSGGWSPEQSKHFFRMALVDDLSSETSIGFNSNWLSMRAISINPFPLVLVSIFLERYFCLATCRRLCRGEQTERITSHSVAMQYAAHRRWSRMGNVQERGRPLLAQPLQGEVVQRELVFERLRIDPRHQDRASHSGSL